MFDAKGTRLARSDLIATYFNLEPAIAAGRTASAGPVMRIAQGKTSE
jgi:hypothetical protein